MTTARIWHIVRSVMLIAAVAGVLLAPAGQALAATDPFGDVCSMDRAGDSTVCQTPQDDIVPTIRGIASIISIIAGVAAVIVLVVGGIRYISSNGENEQIAQSKRTIIFAVIGLVVIGLAQVIINFVISRL